MSPEGGRAPSLLCLIVIAAGLNIYSISSMNTSTSNTAKIELTNHTFTLNSNLSAKAITSPVTLSFTTPLIPTERNTTPWSTPNDTSSTSKMTVSTSNLLSQPSIGLQSTEQMSTLVMPVDSSATTNVSHAEIVATTTSDVMSVSSISSSSFVPENYTSSWVTQLSSTEVSTVPLTSKERTMSEVTTVERTMSEVTTVERTMSEVTTVKRTTSEVTTVERTTSEVTTKPSSSVGKSTYSANKTTVQTTPIGNATLSPEVTMQEVQQGLSSGSIAAITITVIAVVLFVFGIAAFLKIRRSSYGRLFDDHDYGSWGNYNNPLYDDS